MNDSSDSSVVASMHTLEVQRLFVTHQSRLKGYVLSLEPDFATAEDVLQEVFLLVSRKAADFQPGTSFLAWARRIALYKILQVREKRGRGPRYLSDETLAALAAAAPDAESEEVYRQKAAAVSQCIEKLAPRARELIKQRYFHEHRPEEIAAKLGQTPGSVNVALSQARVFLRKCLERELNLPSREALP